MEGGWAVSVRVRVVLRRGVLGVWYRTRSAIVRLCSGSEARRAMVSSETVSVGVRGVRALDAGVAVEAKARRRAVVGYVQMLFVFLLTVQRFAPSGLFVLLLLFLVSTSNTLLPSVATPLLPPTQPIHELVFAPLDTPGAPRPLQRTASRPAHRRNTGTTMQNRRL